MKIAIPTKNNEVDSHFGHCEYYTIVTVDENNNIQSTEKIESPQGCGCKSDIASVFNKMGVKVMLAGNIGQGAINKIGQAGIKVIRGCAGDVNVLAKAYLSNELVDSGLTCSEHGDEGHSHVCNH